MEITREEILQKIDEDAMIEIRKRNTDKELNSLLMALPVCSDNQKIFIPGVKKVYVSRYFSVEKQCSINEVKEVIAASYESPGGWKWIVDGGWARGNVWSSEEIAKVFV